jgi:hypothetical protein
MAKRIIERRHTAMRAALFSLCVLLLPSGVFAADPVPVKYLETHGAKSAVMEYGVAPSAQGIRITSAGGGSVEEMLWVPGTGAVAFRQIEESSGTDLRGERTGDTIRFRGTVKGKSVSREVKVDAEPWYQIFGPIITELLPPDRQQRDFWVVNPDDLAPHKMMVRRAGAERITLAGVLTEALKIHFSPAGGLAPFWGADFWYRPQDSTWLYSRLPENGGLTVTTIADPQR